MCVKTFMQTWIISVMIFIVFSLEVKHLIESHFSIFVNLESHLKHKSDHCFLKTDPLHFSLFISAIICFTSSLWVNLFQNNITFIWVNILSTIHLFLRQRSSSNDIFFIVNHLLGSEMAHNDLTVSDWHYNWMCRQRYWMWELLESPKEQLIFF